MSQSRDGDFPAVAARTRGFRCGAPRTVTVSADGERVIFLRSAGPEDQVDRLWVLDVATGAERLIADPANLLAAAPPAPAGIASAPADGDAAQETGSPAEERALRERMRLATSGIGSYATDRDGAVATFAADGRLFRADLRTGAVAELATAGPAVDPRLDPTGQRIGYVTGGALHVLAADGTDAVLAGEEGVTWGLADFIAAEEFDRYRGFWWAPDGERILAARVDTARVQRWYVSDPANPERAPEQISYPAAGTTNAQVTLHVLEFDGSWVDVYWDRETYPYLVGVDWTEQAGALLTVLRRDQRHGLVLALDPRTGEVRVHAELADPRWIELVPGTPAYLPDGRVVVSGDLRAGAGENGDARCLFADGSLLTPASLYVRRLAGLIASNRSDGGTDLLVQASEAEPSEQHLYRVRLSAGSVPHAERLTTAAGWHVGEAGGATLVVAAASLDHAGSRVTVRAGDTEHLIASYAADPPYAPRPVLARVTDRRLPTGVLYPRGHVAGRRLPVLVDIYGGPHHQDVLAARSVWLERQWWADHGFGVVVIDNRGTPGVSPTYEKAIHRRMADVVLGDQVDALAALVPKHPDLDLERVAIRGWSYGGWLAALAVLRRPDVYHAAVAGAPVVDWALYDTAYTERYLGLPVDEPDVYAHHNLLTEASTLSRPLLLIHGLADDNVVVAHTLRLSAALTAAARPHQVVPLSGITHMSQAAGAGLLTIELDFLRTALAR